MNSKGLMFTIMAFMLVFSIISLGDVFSQSHSQKQHISEALGIYSADAKYKNINRNIVDLFKNGYSKQVIERSLPFEYNIDRNKIKFSHTIPWRRVIIENYFDAVNIYRVFIADDNFSNVFDGINTDVQTLKNAPWGGSDERLRFLIQPFCTSFNSEDTNKAALSQAFTNKCLASFDANAMRRFDVNVVIKNIYEDFNRVSCSNGCASDSFDAGNPDPYYRLIVDKSDCPLCLLSQTVFSKHSAASSDENILFYCEGASCTSEPLLVRFRNGFLIQRDGNRFMDVNMQVEFDKNIAGFFFLDFNFTVRDEDFNITKTNNPGVLG